jgi:hypothetical protein
MVCTIHRIWEQQLHTQPLWWIEQQNIVFGKTSKKEKIQEHDMYQQCFLDQSHNPQNQHKKSQQDQAMKKRNTNPKLECVFEISKNSLNDCLM